MHPALKNLSEIVEANKNREIGTTQLWLNQNTLLFSSPAIIAALVEIEQLADDCNGKRINIGPRQIQNIIANHLEPLK